MSAWNALYLVGIVLGLVGLFVLWRALFADRSRGRRRCPKCWYDMAGVPGLTCPECGKTVAAEKRLQRTRRHGRTALAGVCVLLLAAACALTPELVQRGWRGAIPLWTVLMVMEVYDTEEKHLEIFVSEELDSVITLGAAGAVVQAQPRRPAWLSRVMLARLGTRIVTADSPDAAVPKPWAMNVARPANWERGLTFISRSGPQAVAHRQALVDALCSTDGRETVAKDCITSNMALYSAAGPSLYRLMLNADEEQPAIDAATLVASTVPTINLHPREMEKRLRHAYVELGWRKFVVVAVPLLAKQGPLDEPGCAMLLELQQRGANMPEGFSILIDSPHGASFVREYLASVRTTHAMEIIGARGPKCSHLEPIAVERLQLEVGDNAARWTSWALHRIGAASIEASDALVRAATRTSFSAQTRRTAIEALIARFPNDPRTRSIAESSLEDSDVAIRVVSRLFVARFEDKPKSQPAVPTSTP
jgi:hypothetical protein